MDLNHENITILKENKALLQGHFILSSGLHSEYYIQCAQIFSNPAIATLLCQKLVTEIKNKIDINQIDLIVAPAMGGVIIGYEIARQLNKPNFFCERVNGTFQLRRGFAIKPTDRILVIEDVITTGKSSLETYEAIREYSNNIVAEACLIKRNPDLSHLDNIPLISLIDIEIPTYDPHDLPEHLSNITAIKPGSRNINKNASHSA